MLKAAQMRQSALFWTCVFGYVLFVYLSGSTNVCNNGIYIYIVEKTEVVV